MSIRRLQNFMMYDEVIPAETKMAERKNEKNPSETDDSTENEDNPKDKGYPKDNAGDTKDNLLSKIEHCVSIENGSAKWLDYEREATLQNVTMKVRPGELIAIVGQVGAGKSSLLNVILKELRLQQGSIQVRGTIESQ